MNAFSENRPYIEDEFRLAHFDPETGLPPEALSAKLNGMQAAGGEIPRPLFLADAYSFLLDNVQLEINEHTPFAVKLNLGIDYSYFASTDIFDRAIFQRQRVKVVSERLPEDYRRMRECESAGMGSVWADYWHTVPNWPFLLENGFAGILRRAEDSLRAHEAAGDARAAEYLRCVTGCYRAILRLMRRIAAYSARFDVPDFTRAVTALAERPPETLYEVMLFSVLYLYFEEIGCERARTLGPIDALYLPYYRRDLERGGSREQAEELFRYFFLHFTATKRFAEQPFTMCGGSADGTDRTNELSRLILDVYDELDIYDPKIHFRYHRNLDGEVFLKVVSMIRKGNNSVCLLNDEAVFRGYERIGIPRADAQDYVLLGCYEPVIMGKEEAEIGVTWLNMVKCLELALYGGADPLSGKTIGLPETGTPETFEDFFASFLRQLDYAMDFAVSFGEAQGLLSREVNPSPVYSASFPECIAKGADVHEYPLRYNNMSVKPFGLATVVDSLTAVRKYVYERRDLTLEELKAILRRDWEGAEGLRDLILRDGEKYGNGLDGPDGLTVRITEHLAEKYCGRKLLRGGFLRLGMDSINHCISLGRKTGATPDGRQARAPFSKNLCAVSGMDRGGITAYMRSVLKIDASAFLNSAVLDFVLHPSSVEGEKGLRDLAALLRVFFEAGGFAAQGNVVSGETLREAQAHPEKYPTLQIRVCGWNEYFVKLSREAQDQFIKRSEAQK